jgi:hypothetical protein
MPFSLNKVIDSVRPGHSRRSSASSVRRQSKINTPYPSSSPVSSPLTSPIETPRESVYPEVPEMYYNARLDPKNFLEGQFGSCHNITFDTDNHSQASSH